MSSRVQKGGTIFKPVARPKGRAAGDIPRQNSTAPDPRASAVPNSSRDAATPAPMSSSSMPPPPGMPTKSGLATISEPPPPQSTLTQNSTTSNDSSTPSHAISMPSRDRARPPSAIPSSSSDSRSLPAIISTPSRSTPAPPSIGTSRAVPIVVSSQRPTPIAHPSTRPAPPPPAQNDSSQQPGRAHSAELNQASQPLSMEGQVLPIVDGNVPRLALNTPSVVKVPTARSRGKEKQQSLHQDGSVNGAEDTTNENSTEVPTRKSTRRKKPVKPTTEVGEDGGAEQEPEPTLKKKRSRKRKETTEDETGEGEGEPVQKRKRGGRKKAPSPPPYDPDVDPGEDLDPTVVTMATLCDDPGQGRVSSKAAQIQKNFTAWKVVNREKRARMKALQEAKKYGRDDEDEGRSRINPKAPDASASQALVVPGTAASTTDDIIPEEQDDQDEGGGEKSAVDGFDYNQAVSTSRFNVQLRIGANGETIIDEDSLFVDRGEEHETEEYTHIEESDTSKFVNSATYSKKVRGSRWSAEETELFYDALSQFGENYELISMVLPGRDRKACKNKFKAEDKRNPTRINYSLTHRVPYDMQTLTRMTGKDFSGPTPVIRAPTPPTLPVPEQVTEVMNTRPKKGRKQSSTPAAGADEEVVGSLEDFEMDEELFGKDSPFEKGLSSTS